MKRGHAWEREVGGSVGRCAGGVKRVRLRVSQ